ncbi:mitochondrial ribosomal protein S9 isoform X1 [Brevipalpus obovatus]|uniref:mitochondrial ribosomal protein S9 isoform X1 n=1 Tax=Brevipalpus obovatus TaxID=246614 RepID=UPI003D9DB41E
MTAKSVNHFFRSCVHPRMTSVQRANLATNSKQSSLKPHTPVPDNVLRKPSQPLSDAGKEKIQKISESMKSFLAQARQQSEILKEKRTEFDLGRRHLANIMGYDSNTMSQKDVDEAIKYLFPSGLYSHVHRPVMWPPEDIYPKLKDVDFDISGRPFHCFAYTKMHNFYQIMYDINENFEKCNELEDKMIAKGVLIPPPEARVDFIGTRWMEFDELKRHLLEEISHKQYSSFIYGVSQLEKHPYSDICKDFLMQYRIQLGPENVEMAFPDITITEEGRRYVQAEGRRKTSKSKVTVWLDGSGKFSVNEHDILYFPDFKDRKQILFPLVTSKMLGLVDVVAETEGGGITAQAGAIRHALSLCLAGVVDEDIREEMRVAGLLARDKRFRERNKPGKHGPRRSGAWRPR